MTRTINGTAATKYHLMLGSLEKVSTFCKCKQDISTLRGATCDYHAEKADDERQGQKDEGDPTKPPHACIKL